MSKLDELRALREAGAISPRTKPISPTRLALLQAEHRRQSAGKTEWPEPNPAVATLQKPEETQTEVQPGPRRDGASSPSHRGRVKGFLVGVRLQPELLAKLDRLRGKLSRPEQIRLLLEERLP